jgi:hypothetical protein
MRPSRFVRQTALRARRDWHTTPQTDAAQIAVSRSQNRETKVALKTTAKITARRE